MGYDVNHFYGGVNDELICPICCGVLEEPVQSALCEHAFCRGCITESLSRQETCPVDKNTLTIANLIAVPRLLRNLLSRLSIKCDNAAHGCALVLNFESLNAHLEECKHNPKRLCEKCCGLIINTQIIDDQQKMIDTQQKKIDTQQKKIDTQAMEMGLMQKIIDVQQKLIDIQEKKIDALEREIDTQQKNLSGQVDRDDVLFWSRTLPRWEIPRLFLINEPNRDIETVIRRALSDSGCPTLLLDKLMENCQKRRWPRGFSSTVERRCLLPVYIKCVWRRIPDTKVVLILSCENTHISDEALLVEPGLIVHYFD